MRNNIAIHKCADCGILSGSALFAKIKNQLQGLKIKLNLEIFMRDPMIYTMKHPKCIVSNH